MWSDLLFRNTWNICSDIHQFHRRPEAINVNKTLLRLLSSVISKSLSVSRVFCWLYSEHTKVKERRGVGFLMACLLWQACHVYLCSPVTWTHCCGKQGRDAIGGPTQKAVKEGWVVYMAEIFIMRWGKMKGNLTKVGFMQSLIWVRPLPFYSVQSLLCGSVSVKK